MKWLALGVAFWLCSGVASAGYLFAYFQGEYPLIAAQDYRRDLLMAWTTGVMAGPTGLIYVASMGGFQHGWRLR